MLSRSSCWVGLLLACGGAVDSSSGPLRAGASDPPQLTATSELPRATAPAEVAGAGGSGGGWRESSNPIEPSPSSPEWPPQQSADLPEGTLAVGQAWPVTVVLDATHVYWANWGGNEESGILRVSKQGGAPELLVRSYNRIDSLALDAGHAYFGERVPHTLSRVSLANRASAQVLGNVDDVAWALSDQAVYFMGTGGEGIYAMGKQGGDAQTIVPGVAPSGPVRVHGGHVYWREHYFTDALSRSDSAQRLWRAGIQGGQPETLVTEPNTVLTGLAVDDQAVYYGLAANLAECGCEGGELKWLAHGSTDPRTLATVQGSHVNAITLQPDYIYWSSGSAIHRTSRDGAITETLASELPQVGAIALDEEYLYFGTYESSGSIRRIAR